MTKEGYNLAMQPNSYLTPDFAYFNDNIRDGLKGNVFNAEDTGFVSGKEGMEELITNIFRVSKQNFIPNIFIVIGTHIRFWPEYKFFVLYRKV